MSADLGFYVHNVADLPEERPVGPATLSITAVYLVLVALWFSPVRRFATWVLRVWALLHLVGGGILSVLPLPFLPFDPRPKPCTTTRSTSPMPARRSRW